MFGLVFCFLFSIEAVRSAEARTISVTYEFDRPQIDRREVGARVTVPGCQMMGRTGEPCLPFRTARVLLPPGWKVQTAAARTLAEAVLLDVRGPVEWGRAPVSSRDHRKPSAWASDLPDEAIYDSDAAFPDQRVELVSVQQMAGRAIALVRVFPVQYWPVRGQLVFCPQLKVELNLVAAGPSASALAGQRAPAWSRQRVRAFVDNPESLPEYPRDETAAVAAMPAFDYLLISKASLLPSFQPLVNQKLADGLSVKTETMENILANYGGVDRAEKLRNFIRHAYTNWGLQFVLLGGDIDTVPVRFAYVNPTGLDANSFIPCDLYYSCLDGTWNSDGDNRWGEPNDGDTGDEVDLLGEVYVGRAPVDTIEEANRWVEKAVRHEVIGAPNPREALFLARYLGFFAPGVHSQGGDMLDPLSPAFSAANFQVNWLDDRPFTSYQWTKADAISALNTSPQVAVYNGHGDIDWIMELFIPDLDSLTNQAPFLAYSVGCNAGEFDNFQPLDPDCIGEQLLIRQRGGAFAAVLNTRLGWFSAVNEEQYSGEFQTRFFHHLLVSGHTNLGVANQLSKHDMLGHVEATGVMTYRWCYYEITLFGDPHASLRMPGQNQTSQGTPYWWLFSYGWTNDFEAAALTDTDKDGLAAWQEYTAGTNPMDGASVLKLVCERNSGAGCVLKWPSAAGRSYSIYRSTDLAVGNFVLVTNGLAATPPLNAHTDNVSEASNFFYKLEARLQP